MKKPGGRIAIGIIWTAITAVFVATSFARMPAYAQSGAKADADMQAVLDQIDKLGGKPIETLTPAEARKQPTPADAVKALLTAQGKPTTSQPVGKVEDRMIQGAAGQIPAKVYWPTGNGPFPILVYFHGGGWVIGSPMVYDATPRALVNLARCIVVSVDYRVGPEHKFPAAHDDAFAAYQWALKNAGSINGDPAKVAVGGESAGGNLAVSVAMDARDKKIALPKHMMVVYPIAGSDVNTQSYRENANAKPLNKPMMEWFYKHYLRSPKDAQDPHINLVAANLRGLPPATVITDQIDPLRSEGQMLADRLKAAGVDVETRHYDGVTHEFFGMSAVLVKARQAQQAVADGLRKGFGS